MITMNTIMIGNLLALKQILPKIIQLKLALVDTGFLVVMP